MEKHPSLTSEQISLEDWQNTPIKVRCLVNSLLTSTSVSDPEILLSQSLEANQEIELKLRNLTDAMPGAVYQFRLSPEGSFSMIFMSEGVRELGGISPEQVINDIQVMWDLILPEDLGLLHQSITLSAQTLKPWHLEFRIQTASKKIKWILGQSLPHQQENGAIIWNGLLTDISDRKRIEADRQQAEEGLRQSEDRFRKMAANVPGAIFRYLLRPDGSDSVLYMSPGCYGLWEVEAEAVVQDATILWQMIHPEDQTPMYESVMQSAQTLQPWSWAWRITTPSGQQKWLEASGRPEKQANGEIIWDTLILDVSDRKLVEEKIREQQTQLDLVVEASQIGFYISDLRTETSITSSAYKTQLGYVPDAIEASPDDWSERLHPDDRERAISASRSFKNKESSYSIDFRLRHRDGSYRWIYSNAQLICDEVGTPIKIVGIHLDITDRKQAEAALQKSEQRFRSLFESTPKISVQGYNKQRQVIYWNDASEDLYGYTKTEAIGQQLEDLVIPPEMREGVIGAIQNWLTEGQIIPADELSLMRKDGSRVTVFSSHIMLTNSEGEQEMYCVDIDLSDRKKVEEELHYQKEVLQVVFDHLPLMIGLYSTSGEVLMMNQELEQIVGWAEEEYKTVDVLKACYPNLEDYERVINHIVTANSTWKDFKTQVRDGRILDTSWAQVRLSDGRSIGIGQDITDRQKAEGDLRRAVATNQALIDAIPDLIIRISREGIYLDAISSDNMKLLFPPEKIIGNSIFDFLPTEFAQERMYYIEQAFQTGKLQLYEYQILIDGEIHYQEARIVVSSDNEATVLIRDISDRKQTELSLRESEARYRVLAENINDLVCLHHPDGRYLYVSPSCEALLGYRYDEMLGQDPYIYFHPDDLDRIRQEAHAAAITGKSTPITYRMRQKSGNYIWFETLTNPIMDATGQVIQLQTTSRDVSDRIQVQNQLEYDALHDTLTGLPNRNLLIERLELSIHRAERLNDYHFAVLFLDLDRFKVINDSLGHLAGDKLLIAISRKLQATLREIDLVARLGGDEFVILLDEIKDIQEAIHATQRIFAELQTPLTIEGREVYTTASIGIVLGTKDYAQASHLLRDADIAMYRAKTRGKARYEIFDAEMHRQALSRMHLENDLRRAIDCQEFVLHYQPIVSLDSGYLVGFEALMRWQHPSQGLKYPGDFIAVAEEIGLITPLSSWALRTACQQLAKWQTTFPSLSDLKVSVNLSVQDLRRSDLISEVDLVLDQTQLDARCLTIEITESMLIEDIESTIKLFSQLKERGIQVSLDDFGTGYSSLNYLHRLPMNNLKVDRSFVNQMEEGKKNYQIVETIATLSKQLELDAIAEGIETSHQLEKLKELGYRFGQGYLFSKPLSQEATEALLRNTNLCLLVHSVLDSNPSQENP
ncbi:diguanylate cyclase/phosphodiesterase with PAS/PAC sensor [Pseudanabaena sp. lw0831]|uniref:PAS domain S-box protein n=1 Tax=Pseudanabaena sp. lw0831 TaxID=1357935 RepID=UPI001916705E|nr:PAS domain S-box protein [Pseudanabaena sp. lw0831]GBO55235.1 diguanylate cyclase/phosphodiesterase with PAS/PAC sensor [Pseudanabaena sp. lw0831]